MGVPGRIGDIQPFAEIASGPDTVVYRAHQRSLDRVVLLKVFRGGSGNREALERFAAAARIVARIQHANVVAVYDYGEVNADAYFVTEFVEGADLAAMLENRRVPPELAVFVLHGVSRGLAAAHARGVIHRDIKPANILISHDGDIKLADFGMASLLEEEASRSEVRGTLGYLSPEQIAGERADERSDLFSLGATFFEMLSGRRAFPGDSRHAVLDAILHADPVAVLRADRQVPTEVADITARLLAKSPDDRYASAVELAADLESVQAAFSLPATADDLRMYLQDPDVFVAKRPPTSLRGRDERPQPPAVASRAPAHLRWAAVGALLLLLLLIVPAYFWFRPGAVPQSSPSTTSGLTRLDRPTGPGAGTTGDAAVGGASSMFERDQSNLADDSPAGSLDAPQERHAVDAADDRAQEDIAGSQAARESTAGEDEAAPPLTSAAEVSPDAAGDRPERIEAPFAEESRPTRWVVRAHPWADLYLDDVFIGTGPVHEVTVDAGDHVIRFEHPSFPSHEVRRPSVEGRVDTIDVSLWDTVGRLIVRARPWADVYINGVLAGTVPPHEPFLLAPGDVRVRLQRTGPDGARDTTLHVAAGSTVTLEVDMERR